MEIRNYLLLVFTQNGAFFKKNEWSYHKENPWQLRARFFCIQMGAKLKKGSVILFDIELKS